MRGGDPNAGSAKERGEVDLPVGLAIAPQQQAKLRSVGRVINEADRRNRAGQIAPELLKELGMTNEKFTGFVEEYASRLSRLTDAPDRTDRPRTGVKAPSDTVGAETLQQGKGVEKGLGARGMEELTADQVRELSESRVENVSPEYRRLVEAYLKAVSEAESRRATKKPDEQE